MFEDYLELFINYLESLNRSEVTIKQYKKEIENFIEFLKSRGISNFDEVETIHIDLYQSHLMKVNKSASVAKKITILRSLFKYLSSRKYIKENPTAALVPVRIKDADRKEREVLTEKEALKLLESVSKNSIPSLKTRNELIFLFFIFLGLRVSELCALEVKDIDLKTKTVYVLGKGGKKREVPLFDEIIKRLKKYLKERPIDSELLFTSKQKDAPLDQRSVHDLVKSHVKKAGIKKNIGPHSLRRTSATINLTSGINLRSIQRFLGHQNIGTTMLYLQEDIEEIKEEIRSKNTLAKKLNRKLRKEKKEEKEQK